jgi:hypothetical protein
MKTKILVPLVMLSNDTLKKLKIRPSQEDTLFLALATLT